MSVITKSDIPLVEEADSYVTDPRTRSNPYPFFHRLLDHGPALKTSSGVWLVSRHKAVQSVLRDASSWGRRDAAMAHAVIEDGPELEAHLSRMLTNDGDEHTRLRRLVAPAFSRPALRRWQDRVEAIIADLVGDILPGRRMDVVTEYAYPLPEQLICELIGIPARDQDYFKGLTGLVGEPVPGDDSEKYRNAATAATRGLALYVRDLIAQRRGNEGEDLLSILMLAEEEGSKLRENELVGIIMELIVAGHETTGDLIGNGVLTLAEHPDQYERLTADTDLLPKAIEEILRFEGPAHHSTARAAIRDVDLGDGVVVPAGDTVVAMLGAANRDPDVFEDPDSFDVGRAVNPHVAFGFGTHFCIGNALARNEAVASFGALVARFSRIELDINEPRWRPHQLMRGLETLPVTFH